MEWLLGFLAPSPTRQELLPVIGALAETLLPAQPEQAAAAEDQGDADLAKFYRVSGKQQAAHMQEVTFESIKRPIATTDHLQLAFTPL